MLELFLKGGPLMYPLLFGSILTLSLIIERGYTFLGRSPGRQLARLQAAECLLRQGEPAAATAAARRQPGPLPALFCAVIDNRALPRSELDRKLSAAGSRELKRLSRGLHLLELIGKVAPMIGLSGTVLGLTRTFYAVSTGPRSGDPGVLAGGIWEALITTVSGLFIAIPAIIFFHMFENQLKSLTVEMKSYAEAVLSKVREVP